MVHQVPADGTSDTASDATLDTLGLNADRTAQWLADNPAPAGPIPRRETLPTDPDLAAALEREGLADWSAPNGTGGATIDLGQARLGIITGTTSALAEAYPGVTPTITDRGHGAILMDMGGSEAFWSVAVPEDLVGLANGATRKFPTVTAALAEGITVTAGGDYTHGVGAGTEVATVYRPGLGARRLSSSALSLRDAAIAALDAAAPDACLDVIARLKASAPVAEHIAEDRRKRREDAEVAADREQHSALDDDQDDGGRVDLLSFITNGVKRERPSVYPVTGGRCLFYAGKTHTVFGPGGTGKSTLGQAACLATLRANPDARVLYLDYEDNRDGVGPRLVSMGMTPEENARLDYREFPSRARVQRLAKTQRYDLVVLDGVEGATAAHNVGMNDYKTWHDSVILPLATEAGAAVVLLDHPGHKADRPIGSVFKINALTGAAYRLDNQGRLYLAGTDGKAKDRPAGLNDLTGPGDLLARVDLTEDGDDREVTVTLHDDMNAKDAKDAAEDVPTAPLDVWMADTGTELARGEVVAVAISLAGKRCSRKAVPDLIRDIGPMAYRSARKKAWETEAVNAAKSAGWIVKQSEGSHAWVPGTLSDAAAEAVTALSEDAEK